MSSSDIIDFRRFVFTHRMAHTLRDFGEAVGSALLIRQIDGAHPLKTESHIICFEYVFMVKCIYFENRWYLKPRKHYVLSASGLICVDDSKDIFRSVSCIPHDAQQNFQFTAFDNPQTAEALFSYELNQFIDQGFRPYLNGELIPNMSVPDVSIHGYSFMPDIIGIGLECFQPILGTIELAYFRQLTQIRRDLKLFEYESLFQYNGMDAYKTRGLIGRGIALVDASIYWGIPSIGRPNQTFSDILRGIQWRLVTLFSGFEMLIFGLFGIGDDENPNFANIYWRSPLRRPLLAMADSLLPKISLKAQHKAKSTWVDEFLFINDADRERLKEYLCRQVEINDIGNIVSRAKIFRNLTTHCFISPNKVAQLDLIETYIEMTRQLARFVVVILEAIHRAQQEHLSLDQYLDRKTHHPIVFRGA